MIESVFSNPKRQLRLETHLAKRRLPGCFSESQGLLAVTLVCVNTLVGRPPRALAAYDGR